MMNIINNWCNIKMKFRLKNQICNTSKTIIIKMLKNMKIKLGK